LPAIVTVPGFEDERDDDVRDHQPSRLSFKREAEEASFHQSA
jgi:hypothetical protein